MRRIAAMILVTTFSWGSATSNVQPENALRQAITAEHLRVCGTTLGADNRLTWMARYRATDMVLNGYFAHRNPWTQRTVFSLMARAGITYGAAAEIISWNSYPDYLSAYQAFLAFMGSDSHRAIIQACDYTTLGIGDYKAGARRMFVALFTR